ncbi:MAG: RpiB/LacA/LacB family sugar-phosphate isomerase [Patescibacteria group bacterium]|nr:RpiB/LacA/LacB family sugar-phosphate isomerase [Patescibacteria group bacterium]
MVIYIGADHRGFNHKLSIKEYLMNMGYAVVDVGNENYDELDDYPDFAERVSEKVSINGEKGILICGSGAGVDIVANKFPGVRSALVFNTEQAIDVRADDDANVLSLAADYVSVEDAKKIASLFLSTKFSGAERFKRRLKKIEQLEIDLKNK